jgi:hypothetical protein
MYGDGKPSAAAQAAQSGSAAATGVKPAARAVPVTTTQDYGYVLQDLRRLGLLAVGMFALLVVLGLVIR